MGLNPSNKETKQISIAIIFIVNISAPWLQTNFYTGNSSPPVLQDSFLSDSVKKKSQSATFVEALRTGSPRSYCRGGRDPHLGLGLTYNRTGGDWLPRSRGEGLQVLKQLRGTSRKGFLCRVGQALRHYLGCGGE